LTTPQQQIEDRTKQIDEYERLKAIEDKLPKECNLIESSYVSSVDKIKPYSLSNFYKLNKDTSIIRLKDYFSVNKNEISGIFTIDSFKIQNNMKAILDSQYPNLKLAQLYFGEMKANRLPEPEDKLNKIYLVLQDCTRIEVPAKPDGSFDFESVKGQIE
jgi:hypothetical protein